MTERAYTLTEFNQLRKIAEWQTRGNYSPSRLNEYHREIEERIRTLMTANIDPAAAYAEWEIESAEHRAFINEQDQRMSDLRLKLIEARAKMFDETIAVKIPDPEPERPNFGFWQIATLGIAVAVFICLVINYLT